MTLCNHCTLERIKKTAKEKNEKVVLRPSSFMGGTLVFCLPKGVKIPKIFTEASTDLPNGDEFCQKYVNAWLMEIPDHCTC